MSKTTTTKRTRTKRAAVPELDAALAAKRTETTTPENPVRTESIETTSAGYAWAKDPQLVLGEYLAERTSADTDAPTRYLPTVTAGVLRVHPSDWTEWLIEQGAPAPKKKALQVLKDAGLVQKVYALPGTDGKSAGFYTGTVPAGTPTLPERVVQRSQGKPRSPFGRLTDEQRELLVKALGKLTAERDQVLRDQLLAHLGPSAEHAG
jgi:hypothetical protein